MGGGKNRPGSKSLFNFIFQRIFHSLHHFTSPLARLFTLLHKIFSFLFGFHGFLTYISDLNIYRQRA